ncbi:MAG: hypothetical protein KTR28_06075 [Micavibrio sp.]|nr:hypothetical protein [Micavibrio sp.]
MSTAAHIFTQRRISHKLSARYALFVLLLAQLIPTFGDIFGSPGNAIPLLTAIFGFTLYLVASLSDGVPRRFFLSVTALFLLAIAYTGIITITSPHGVVLRDLAIWIKLAAIYVTFLAGYIYFNSGGSLRTLFSIHLFILLFHIALFFDHLRDPNGPIQVLYHYKALVGGWGGYGINRFPGTWNFPYNETVFLISSAVLMFFAFTKSKNLKRILFFFLTLVACYISLFGTQSRAGFIAFFICIFYGSLAYAFISLIHNRGKALGASLSLFFIFLLIASGVVVFMLFGDMSAFKHLNKFTDPQDASAYKRLEELPVFYSEFDKYPWRIIIGFGNARAQGLYFESFLNYVYNYGLIGSFTILGTWIYLWGLFLFKALKTKDTTLSLAFLCINIVISYTLLIGVSADILLHYRFIPLYYFYAGVAYSFLNLHHVKHGVNSVHLRSRDMHVASAAMPVKH